MTPGEFLRGERERLALSLFDVALRTETTPLVCAAARSQLIGAIEAGLVNPRWADLVTLQGIYGFAWADLIEATESQLAAAVAPVLRRAR